MVLYHDDVYRGKYTISIGLDIISKQRNERQWTHFCQFVTYPTEVDLLPSFDQPTNLWILSSQTLHFDHWSPWELKKEKCKEL